VSKLYITNDNVYMRHKLCYELH